MFEHSSRVESPCDIIACSQERDKLTRSRCFSGEKREKEYERGLHEGGKSARFSRSLFIFRRRAVCARAGEKEGEVSGGGESLG